MGSFEQNVYSINFANLCRLKRHMAERKKSSDKTKSSVRPTTAKPEAEVIDGASAEKMTGEDSVTSNNAGTKSKTRHQLLHAAVGH